MADNSLFCEDLLFESRDQKKWAQAQLERMEALAIDGPDGPEDGEEWDDWTPPLIPMNRAERFAYEQGFLKKDGWRVSYQIDLERIRFLSDGDGDPRMVAQFVRQFFERWRSDGIFVLGYAETSLGYATKKEPGTFGGGGLVVNVKEIREFNVYDWLAETAREMGDKEITEEKTNE